jgi:hypothetical protein
MDYPLSREKSATGSVRLVSARLRCVEYVLDRKERDDGQDLFCTSKVNSSKHSASQTWIDRKLSQTSSRRGEDKALINRTKIIPSWPVRVQCG